MSVTSRRALHIVVSGRVQGVGYRAWTEGTARDLGLVGWVRNLSNGAVEIRCEGASDRVSGFVELLWKGPSHAVVSEVIVSEEPVMGEFSEFSIRR